MDQLIAQFWHLGTLYLGIAVVITTFFVRRIVEQAAPSLKKAAPENDPKLTYKTKLAEWWNGVILYALPVIAGILGATVWRSYFCPEGMDGKDAVMFGTIIGWFSSFLYKVVRKTLKNKTGIDPIPGPIDPTEVEVEVETKVKVGVKDESPKKKRQPKKDEEKADEDKADEDKGEAEAKSDDKE